MEGYTKITKFSPEMDGWWIRCFIDGIAITEGRIRLEEDGRGNLYNICQNIKLGRNNPNRFGYKFSYAFRTDMTVGSGIKLTDVWVKSDKEPKPLTSDNYLIIS